MPDVNLKLKDHQQLLQASSIGAAASSSSTTAARREDDVSCCWFSPSPSAAVAEKEEEEQTVMTVSSSCNSLLSFASSISRDEAEQTLRKRPSFQSLEYALVSTNSDSSTDTGYALSSSEEEEQVITKEEESFATQPLKKVRSAASLQDLIIPKPIMQEQVLPDYKTAGIDPDTYLVQLIEAMHGVKVQPKAALELADDFFPTITEKQMAAYTMQVVNATRQNQVDQLREIVKSQGPEAVDCFNRFGESLLNLACRRGFKDIVAFFLSDKEEVRLNARTRDDGGRTPMHDACWNAEPQLDICTWLVQKDASLLLVRDNRGYTAFQYARKSDWLVWRKFLFDNRQSLSHGLFAAVQTEPHRFFASKRE